MRRYFEGPPNATDKKQVTIEGPLGANKWTWVVEAGLYSLGLESAIHFHNCPEPVSKISDRMHNLLKRLGLPGTFVPWETMSNYRVRDMVKRNKTPLVISLQGMLDRETVEAIREINPIIKIIYWWGPQVRNREQVQRILETDSLVDVLALSFQKDVELLRSRGAKNVVHLPFAACPFHHNRKVKAGAKARRRYGSEVVLISQYGEYEEELVRRVSEALGTKVDVWGSGWSSNQWVNSKGPIFSPRNLEAYACSTIVLNPHGKDFPEHDGLNPAFFEIPAAGGFQITEEQQILQEQPWGGHVATFRNPRELGEKARYYLKNPEARESLRQRLQQQVLEQETYGHRFYNLFQRMQFDPG